MQPTILVTGGAGFIGSHTAFLLAQQGYNVIVLDTLVHGQPFTHTWATLFQADYADTEVLHNIFSEYNVQAVMHFAAYIEVGKSVSQPLQFYENNVAKTITLLEQMLKHHINNFIFSSSCAVYGNPQIIPLAEDHPQDPISPYGKTKAMIETILQDVHNSDQLAYICLRYFNAAGALPEHGLGELHNPETHIIPLLIQAAMEHKPFHVFGSDYSTPDGTCIRDYIHVLDIAHAHLLALKHLQKHHTPDIFNLGTGKGVSIKELITMVEQVTNTEISLIHQEKRTGDPPILVADPSHAHDILQWKADHSDLQYIIKSAVAFAQTRKLAIT